MRSLQAWIYALTYTWQASYRIKRILQAFPYPEETSWHTTDDSSHRWGISKHPEDAHGKAESQWIFTTLIYLQLSNTHLRQMIGVPFLVGHE
jgi:hypothetical protein